MKKLNFMAILFIFIFTGCSTVAVNNEDMLAILNKEVNKTTITTGIIKEVGIVTVDDNLLFVGMDDESTLTTDYYAAEFMKIKDNKYEFVKMVKLHDYGFQIVGRQWKHGDVFVCNNDKVQLVEIVIEQNGKVKRTDNIMVLEQPFIKYVDLSDIVGDYNSKITFLDKDGKEVR